MNPVAYKFNKLARTWGTRTLASAATCQDRREVALGLAPENSPSLTWRH